MSYNDAPTSSVPPFSFGVRLGIVFIVQSACLSAIAVSFLLLYIGYAAITVKRGASRKWTVSTHIHYYFVNLLISDLVQAIGGIMSVKWIVDSRVEASALCTAQGIFKQAGDVGVALTTLVIALHTFCVLIFRWHSPPRVALIIIGLIWLFIVLIIGLSLATHVGKNYYGPTQYWCWITERYFAERLGLEYLWMWLTAFINIILYAIMALVIKGVVVVDGHRLHIPSKRDRVPKGLRISSRNENMKSNLAVAMELLFYPAVYIITVAPVAIVRWMAFSGKSVPFEATAFASVLFSSSGLLNVILFASTRPKLMPTRGNIHTFGGNNTFGSPTTPTGMAFTSRISIQRRDHALLTNDYDIEAWKAASQHSTLDTSSSVPRITKVTIHTEKTVHGESESDSTRGHSGNLQAL